MIVPMKKLWLLCQTSDQRDALDRLRDLGVVHVTHVVPPAGDSLDSQQEKVREATEALGVLKRLTTEAGTPYTMSPTTRVRAILDAARRQRDLAQAQTDLAVEIGKLERLGSFNPDTISSLTDQGVFVSLYALANDEPLEVPEGAVFERLQVLEGDSIGVLISRNSHDAIEAEHIPLPHRGLLAATEEMAEKRQELIQLASELSAHKAALDEVQTYLAAQEEACESIEVRAGMAAEGPITYLSGFCPEDDVSALHKAALKHGWGLLIRDPAPDERPPSIIRSPAWVQPIKAVFNMLGIVPGYREADVSMVFLLFFSVFFAMLIGDAGYGVLFLVATILFRKKMPEAPAYPFTLFYVLSVCTIIWGILTANVFGIGPAEGSSWPLQVTWLAEVNSMGVQANLMKLCFLIGAIHLTVAHVWNTISIWPDKRAFAQIGWVCMVWAMYGTACTMVLQLPAPVWLIPVGVIGLLLIILFMTPKDKLKENAIDHAMLPLDVISCLVDVISYIRLFAVGMASLYVARNFNEMATGIGLPIVLKIPVTALILLLGHSLNIALGALAILVHAVRLNTLEFSQHKGMEWAGFAYAPFRKRDKPTTSPAN
jgi:V/A-type H+-transporting ATPase subunit I